MRALLASLILCVVLPMSAHADTITVGGPDGDYPDIPNAVAAAVDGDVILVRPGGYFGMLIEKAITVRASSGRATLFFGFGVGNIPAGKTAVVSGFNLMSYGSSISNCQGSVVLENLKYTGLNGGATLNIKNCADVSITDLEIIGTSQAFNVAGMVDVIDSTVRLSSFSILGASGAFFPLKEGAQGITALNSTLYVSLGSAIGGEGGTGSGCGENGGDGLTATNSTIHLIGSGTETFVGGNGGDAGAAGCTAGAGGNGLTSVNSMVLVSQVSFAGGTGGLGDINGPDGVPTSGPGISYDPRVPQLTVDGDLNPGDSFQLTFQAVEPGFLILDFGGTSGFVPAGHLGPPLSVVPWGLWFFAWPQGHRNAGETYTRTLAIPNDTLAQGLLFHAQGGLFSDFGGLHFSNAVSRTVGE